MKIKQLKVGFTLGLSLLSLVACGHGSINKQSYILKSQDEQQLEFEEEYISRGFSYAEGGKFAISLISNFATIAGGVAFDSPTAVVSGVFGVLNSINDNLIGNKGPSIKDVLDKLNEMDIKLDNINKKLDQNHNQLLNEEVRTQAKVDQVYLAELENAITAFNTDYVVPLDNFKRDLSDYYEQSYKSFVNKDNQIEVDVYKNDKKEWCLVPLMEKVDFAVEEIKFEIKDFPNSITFLEKNYNTVAYGFMDDLMSDIDNAVANLTLPKGLDKENFRNMVIADYTQEITRDYFINNHQKVLDLRNLVINYAKQLSGKGNKSVVARYLERFEYLYNFASEMKEDSTHLLSNLMYQLDTNVALAAQGCLYGETSQDELRKEYIDARELIKNYFEGFNKIDGRYCFVTKNILNGDIAHAHFDAKFSNKGNSCTFKSEFKFEKVRYADNYKTFNLTEENVYSHRYLEVVDHMRIVTRMKLMMEIGICKPTSYIDYLGNNNIICKDAIDTYHALITRKWASEDAFRIFTGLNIRDMNDSDKNIKMTCNDSGNEDGDYFQVGNVVNFRGKYDNSNWAGKVAETTFLDGKDGSIMSNKVVAAYATYNESHFYWVDDEHYSFLDNPVGNYFFYIEAI